MFLLGHRGGVTICCFKKYHSYMDYKRNTIYVYGCDSIFVLERQEEKKVDGKERNGTGEVPYYTFPARSVQRFV